MLCKSTTAPSGLVKCTGTQQVPSAQHTPSTAKLAPNWRILNPCSAKEGNLFCKLLAPAPPTHKKTVSFVQLSIQTAALRGSAQISPREVPLECTTHMYQEQYVPLPYFFGMSMKADDCPAPITTHTRINNSTALLCQHTQYCKQGLRRVLPLAGAQRAQTA
jgi:hypothetical protein